MAETRKVVLYQSTDLKLRQFETQYGRSLINEKYLLIEHPFNIVEDHSRVKFVDDFGQGFVVSPVSMVNTMIQFRNELGQVVSRNGLIVDTKTGHHVFYYV